MIGISCILKHSTALALFALGVNVCLAQSAKFDLSSGNEAYEKKEYETALKKYSDALALDPNYAPAEFNTANTYYRQEKMDEAIREFRRIAKTSEIEETQAKAYHNLGNAYLQNSKLKEAIEAYKNSLRINPDDHETRYNLAFAQRMLKQNPQQQEQEKDQKQDEEKQDKEDEEKQDESKEDKKDGEEPSDNNEEGDKDKDEQEQPDGEPKEDEMSKEDAERLLQMLEDEEKETQEDLMKKKVKVKKVNIEKDW
ncbi:MAG: tetratricopeptide repeat protein [Salibacteraceae bacterium]|nr:tetratricopeptide repeat protein [Salibacteraceae bacterium]